MGGGASVRSELARLRRGIVACGCRPQVSSGVPPPLLAAETLDSDRSRGRARERGGAATQKRNALDVTLVAECVALESLAPWVQAKEFTGSGLPDVPERQRWVASEQGKEDAGLCDPRQGPGSGSVLANRVVFEYDGGSCSPHRLCRRSFPHSDQYCQGEVCPHRVFAAVGVFELRLPLLRLGSPVGVRLDLVAVICACDRCCDRDRVNVLLDLRTEASHHVIGRSRRQYLKEAGEVLTSKVLWMMGPSWRTPRPSRVSSCPG